MIHFHLRCEPAGHGFDGWFRSGADFDRQVQLGLVTCPDCGATTVAKALMAPSIARGEPACGAPSPSQGEASASAAEAPAAPSLPGPAELAAAFAHPDAARFFGELQAATRRLKAGAENVGPRFAEEARRIHYGESDRRQIFGEASRREVDALAEEGIAAMPLMPLPEDHN